jgi:glycosyltransferase involved in cell wall biosynthesis
MLTVLIIVENLPVPFDRRVWMEAITLRSSGYNVKVICPIGTGYEETYEEIEGIQIYRHSLPHEISSSMGYIREYIHALVWEFRLIRKIWKNYKFDIIHICNPPDLLFLNTLWYKWIHGVKVIFDQHDLNPEMYKTKFDRKDIFYYALKSAEYLTYKSANIVITTNESYKKIAIERGRRKADDIFIVRSGPDLNRFKIDNRQVNEFHNNRKYLVGYVGVMGEQEGIDYLLRSVHHIVHSKNRKDIHFMLIGSGPAVDFLKQMVKQLRIDDFIEFTGRVTDDELISRLSNCDVCVNPDPKTPFNDRSTMNKIMEYMALAKPIVQYDLTEGRRSAGDASLYAAANDERDFAEKILYLLDNSKKRQWMGLEGRKRMEEKLEWKHQMPRLLQAYQSLNGKVR